MDRKDKEDYYAGYGQEDRNLKGSQHRLSQRGRTSFDRNNEEYEQRGGRDQNRNRDDYNNHTRSNAGDRYRDDQDDRFDDRNQYSSSRNYGGMGGYGGAQGFGSGRGGQHRHDNRQHDHVDFTSGRRRQDQEEDHRQDRTLYGAYRGPESFNQNERSQYGYDRNREDGNQDSRNRSRSSRGNDLSRSGFANSGDNQDRFRDSEQISKGNFSPMLGGNESNGWYHPSDGGYTREGGYVSNRDMGFGHRQSHRDQDNDTNYGQTFGDDIHYDPTSRNPRDNRVMDEEVRSRAKYGSENRDLSQVRGWHYDQRLDQRYGRDGKHLDWDRGNNSDR